MKKLPNYEKKQLEEQKETNLILLINTIATVITGIASLIVMVAEFMK